MPDVRPFRAWRFDPQVAGPLDRLTCPPYDVISQADAQRLLDRNPYNAIHLELGAGSADPADPDNRYERAAHTLSQWEAAGVLRQDAAPCFYVYEQRFELARQAMTRRSFLAGVRLTPWSAGDVLPHEATLAAPKADRMALLAATRTNISPIYALCDPALDAVTALLATADERAPDAAAVDEAHEQHRLWAVDAADLLDDVARALAGRPLYIADGHHRYETALAYAQRHPDSAGADGSGYVLMAIAPADDPGLAVLPTHRLLRDVPERRLRAGLARLGDAFALQELDGDVSAEALERAVAAAGEPAFGFITPERAAVLRPRADAIGLADIEPALRELDAALAQTLLLERVLGLTADDARRQAHVDYTRSAREAVSRVRQGRYQAAVILQGTPPATIVSVARAGARMPQKSTYFYPKLATGLALRRF